VLIETTGAERAWFTVMHGITVDDRKLPPCAIFKQKTLSNKKPNMESI
jgi:hypothetical protein